VVQARRFNQIRKTFLLFILLALAVETTRFAKVWASMESTSARASARPRATAIWSLTRQGTNSAGDAFAANRAGTFIFMSSGAPTTEHQRSDQDFNANVARRAYLKHHPRVLFDEAHNNPDTSSGRYRPFAELVTSDGYRVVPNKDVFSKKALKGFEVLVVVNASGPTGQRDRSPFTEEECDAVRDWVSGGGALLLITDHSPYSNAVADLVKRFGVEVTNGYTIDGSHHNQGSDDETELVFARDGGLAEHQITKGRDSAERINRVVTFTGTSLKGPGGSFAFLKLADTAKDVLPPPAVKSKSPDEPAPDHTTVSAAGRAQGLALEFGKGRVVVLSEAAMLTAQVTPRGLRFGINVSGTDNRQLALNIMHWLSGLLR
jgi:hypothetical protein